MIKGIGPIYAKKLVRAFSEAVYDVIEQKPERLHEVDGSGPKRADSIVAAWADQEGDPRDHDLSAQPRCRHVTRRTGLAEYTGYRRRLCRWIVREV